MAQPSEAHAELILPSVQSGPVWLHVGELIDGTSLTPRRDAHVVYDSDGFTFVGSDGHQPPREVLRPGCRTPDLSDARLTLLPSLIDAHTHLFLEGGELDVNARAAYLQTSSPELIERAMPRLPLLARLGLAGVRDAGDKDGVGLALSRLAENDDRPLMPYVESPGSAIHRRGRYGSFMAEAFDDFASPFDCVASRVAAGADRIKLIPTGIINFKQASVTAAPQMSSEEVGAFVAAARHFSRQTFAHASGDAGIENAIVGGVDCVEHGFFVRDDQLARMRDNDIAWVPTFAPVQKQIDHADRLGWPDDIVDGLRRIIDGHRRSLVRADALGVRIVAGSDAGSYGVAHGLGLLEEMQMMESAGLSPLHVVNSATGRGAERLAYKIPIGRVAAGYRSRFILTAHSPAQTVVHLTRPRTVVFDRQPLRPVSPGDLLGL